MNHMKRSIHIFIVWQTALQYKTEILKIIERQFKILKLYTVQWSENKFSKNLTCFYEEDLRRHYGHVKMRGSGQFLMVIVEDLMPDYIELKTRRGLEHVNRNVNDVKWYVRNEITHMYNFHGSLNEQETRANLVKILGVNLEDLLKTVNLNGSEHAIIQDCPGVNGWKNLEEIFYVINECSNYVVLRGYEYLPNRHRMDQHGDIDILVDNMPAVINVLTCGEETINNQFEFFTWLTLCGDEKESPQKILFHIKYVGDGYYDKAMEQKILDTKIYNKNGIYIPNTEMYFWSLLYHGLLHKENFIKYSSELKAIAPNLGIDWKDDKEYLCELLSCWLQENRYTCRKHLDQRAGCLQTHNLRNGLEVFRYPEIYAYIVSEGTWRFSVAYICNELIRDNSELFSSLIQPNDPLFDVEKHVLKCDTPLYWELVARYNEESEFYWKYTLRYQDISLMTYSHKGEESYFTKKFLSNKNFVTNGVIKYFCERNIEIIHSGQLESEFLCETMLKEGISGLSAELIKYINVVFEKYKSSLDENFLTGQAWDAVPKNCMITDGGYAFFDFEAVFCGEIEKIFVLAAIVKQTVDFIELDHEQEKILYEICKNTFGLGGKDYQDMISQYNEQIRNIIVNCVPENQEMYRYYFYPDIIENSLLLIEKHQLLLQDYNIKELMLGNNQLLEDRINLEQSRELKLGKLMFSKFRHFSGGLLCIYEHGLNYAFQYGLKKIFKKEENK